MSKNPHNENVTLMSAARAGPKAPAPRTGEAPLQSHAQPPSDISPQEAQSWRDRILAAGSDDEMLLQLAHQAPSVDLKVAALEALTQEDSSKRAMREFRDHDKRLYRAAKSRWREASGRRKVTAEANVLIASARALLEQELIPDNRAVELDHAWTALNVELLDAATAAEFAALSAQLGARVRARGVGEQAITRWLAAADHAIGELSTSLGGVAQGDVPPAATEALAARLLELLGANPDASDARCNEKTDAANRALALASGVVARAVFLQSLPAPGIDDEANDKARIERWRGFPEVSEKELQSVLARRFADWRNACVDERQREEDARRAHDQQQKAEQKQRRLGTIERDVAAAEAAHAAGQIAELTRLLTVIDRALKTGPVNAALGRRIDSLRREQLRLREWQRWSSRQHHEELVAEARALALAGTGKVMVKAHAEAIEKLRQRWKDLDKVSGATNQALWLAFDGELKAAYAPVAAHLEKLKIARDENLAARNRVVDGLVQAAAKYVPAAQEGVAAAPDAGPDWRAIARALEDAKIAWRKLGPVEHTVPRKAQRGDAAVTTRYAAAVQALENPLKEAYREATQLREKLIAGAKALVGSKAPMREVIDQVRGLQAQWQTNAKALALPRRDEAALWAAFKAATDAIFTERDAARAAKETEFSARIKAREDIIERLTALSSSTTAAEIKRAMAEAETAWRSAAEIPRPQTGKLDARYRAARDALTKRLGELTAHAAQARFDSLIVAMALCREREGSGEQAADLEARWHAIENLPDAWKPGLEARFRGEASLPAGKSSESLPELLLKLEVACGIDSPAEFLAARQHLKLRALKDAMEGRRASVTTPEDIERWLLAAAATPNADEPSRERLAKIIAAVRLRRRG